MKNFYLWFQGDIFSYNCGRSSRAPMNVAQLNRLLINSSENVIWLGNIKKLRCGRWWYVVVRVTVYGACAVTTSCPTTTLCRTHFKYSLSSSWQFTTFQQHVSTHFEIYTNKSVVEFFPTTLLSGFGDTGQGMSQTVNLSADRLMFSDKNAKYILKYVFLICNRELTPWTLYSSKRALAKMPTRWRHYITISNCSRQTLKIKMDCMETCVALNWFHWHSSSVWSRCFILHMKNYIYWTEFCWAKSK